MNIARSCLQKTVQPAIVAVAVWSLNMARIMAIGLATFALLISAAFMAQAGSKPIFFDSGDVALTQAV